MTKQEMMEMMRLLSALESLLVASKTSTPDYLFEQLAKAVDVLEREILK